MSHPRNRRPVPPSARRTVPVPPDATTPANFKTNGALAAEFLSQANAFSTQGPGVINLASLWRAAGSPSDRSPQWFWKREAERAKSNAAGGSRSEVALQAIHYLMDLDPELGRLADSIGRVVDTMEDSLAVFATYPEPAVAACIISMLVVYWPALGMGGVVGYLRDFIEVYGQRQLGDAMTVETAVAQMSRALRGESFPKAG